MSAEFQIRSLRNPVSLEWLPVVIGLLVLCIPTFYNLADAYWGQDDYAHGPIILAVILWLIWDKREVLLCAATQTSPIAGVGLLLFGLLLYVLGRSQGVPLLEVGALIPILSGVLLAMRGTPGLRAMWFMLLFIVYLIPLPGFVVYAVTLPLKQNISVIAEQILYAAGYPVALDGVIISIGQYQLLVSDACSGLNSMFSLTALGLLYLYKMRYKSWLHNGLILLSLLPIAFFANIVRVMILVLVTYHFGDATGQGFIHGFSGMMLFVFSLLAILVLDGVLARLLKREKQIS